MLGPAKEKRIEKREGLQGFISYFKGAAGLCSFWQHLSSVADSDPEGSETFSRIRIQNKHLGCGFDSGFESGSETGSETNLLKGALYSGQNMVITVSYISTF